MVERKEHAIAVEVPPIQYPLATSDTFPFGAISELTAQDLVNEEEHSQLLYRFVCGSVENDLTEHPS